MRPFFARHRPLVAVVVVGVLGTSAGIYLHHRFVGQAPVPLSDQALVGKWRGAVNLPTGGAGHRHHADFPLDLAFRPDGTVDSESFGHMEGRYSVRGRYVTYSHMRFRGRTLQPVQQQASIVGDTLTLTNRDKSVAVLRRG